MPRKTEAGRRSYDLWYLYKMTADEYNARLEAQGGICALCSTSANTDGRRLYVDHDHACCSGRRSCGKCIRGIVCAVCNIALSKQDKDPEWALRLHNYQIGH